MRTVTLNRIADILQWFIPFNEILSKWLVDTHTVSFSAGFPMFCWDGISGKEKRGGEGTK